MNETTKMEVTMKARPKVGDYISDTVEGERYLVLEDNGDRMLLQWQAEGWTIKPVQVLATADIMRDFEDQRGNN